MWEYKQGEGIWSFLIITPEGDEPDTMVAVQISKLIQGMTLVDYKVLFSLKCLQQWLCQLHRSLRKNVLNNSLIVKFYQRSADNK